MIEWNRRNIIALVLALLSLACGGVIYLAFRSEDLLLYKAVDACGGMSLLTKMRNLASANSCPEWVVYSLPDALWLTAYLLVINTIWKNKNMPYYKLFAYLMPGIAIATELCQYIGVCPGTFDYADLIAYIIPLLILTPLRYEM